MSEEAKKTAEANATPEEKAATEAKEKPITDPNEQLRKLAKGKMQLETPIRAGGKDITELEYDFQKLTGWEYADAMDSDYSSSSMFRISNRQAFCLFAAAAGKVTPGIDATDIRERMGSTDAVKAVQLATIFFTASARAGNKRISNA